MIAPAAAARRKHAFLADASPFSPAPGTGNAHLQTLYGTLFRSPPDLGAQPEEWTTPDGDFLMVHVKAGDPDGPIAILLHGLEGSSRSPYVRGLGARLFELGYTVAAVEQRSCSGRLNRARRLYHSGTIDDLEFVVRSAIERWPGRGIFINGVSLGGNQLGRWLGTHVPPDAVRAAAIVSAPFDLTVSGPHLDQRGPAYVRYFLRSLVPKALAKERQYPGCVDRDKVAASRTFDDFDTHATAALHGFTDAQDYYRKVSCGQYLGGVRVPTLLVASADDPFNPGTTLPRRTADASDYLVPRFTYRGGHVGFVSGAAWRPRYWMDGEVARFFETHRRAED